MQNAIIIRVQYSDMDKRPDIVIKEKTYADSIISRYKGNGMAVRRQHGDNKVQTWMQNEEYSTPAKHS